MLFRELVDDDYNEFKPLVQKLWDITDEEVKEHWNSIISSSKEANIGCFKDKLIGFVQVSLRSDYVAGTNSSPVGYIEGIFVEEKYRKQHIGSLLLKEAEKYAVKNGCTEMGSDLEIANEISLKFHIENGYIERERVVVLSKKIN